MPFDDSSWPSPQPERNGPWEKFYAFLRRIIPGLMVLILAISIGALGGMVTASFLAPTYPVVDRAPLWVRAVTGMIVVLGYVLCVSWYEEWQAHRARKRGEQVLDLRKKVRK